MKLYKEIVEKAKKVLVLQRNGIKLIFPDVLAIEEKLIGIEKEEHESLTDVI